MTQTDEQLEIERLRTRVAALERELVEIQSRANAAVAAAEERAYWLERWHLDLNAVMRRPAAKRARALLRTSRRALRLARQVKRRLAG